MPRPSIPKIRYSEAFSKEIDPDETHLLFAGHPKDLVALKFKEVKDKFNQKVPEQHWNEALKTIHSENESGTSSSPTSVQSLYLNRVCVAPLPAQCSRHNTPSHCHSLTKIIKNQTPGSGKSFNVVLVVDKRDALASAAAVARAFPTYSEKTGSEEVHQDVLVEFILNDGETLSRDDVEVMDSFRHGIQVASRIVDSPCNVMHVDAFVEEVKKIGKALNIQPEIIQGEELDKRGFGGIYGVGKAAVHKPALAILSHTPEGATETVAWVGKGIVYDTGGLSIKGKTAMPGMKRDCGGAAGILGAFYAAVKSGFSQNLHALLCLAENAVGPEATRPDDIHRLYSGRTVEINNTDAEGRLVVSDGVVYAKKDLKADIIVDMCTLTGAQGISTGKYHAAHLTNNQDWENYCFEAGRISGDLSFPLVYCPELHFSEFSSHVADMKNSVADRSNAQSSCAGLFINAHLGFQFPGVWLHIDMASPAYTGERATGYGVALLNTLFGKYSKATILNTSCPISDENGDNSSSKRKKLR